MKNYIFFSNKYIVNYSSSFRDKKNIIDTVIGFTQYILTLDSSEKYEYREERDDIEIVYYSDKMNRLFIKDDNKIHSFAYPFNVKKDNEHYSVWYNNTEITSSICSILNRVLTQISHLEKMTEIMWTELDEDSIIDSESLGAIIVYLLQIEPGYVRFDYDEERMSPSHPLHHLDINYTDDCTYKIGLKNKKDINSFINILNTKTMPFFLQD